MPVLPLDIVPLFVDIPWLELLLMPDVPVLPVLELLIPGVVLMLPEPVELELPMPLELVEPVVEGEPLAGCERSPCDRLELGGVVVLLDVPLVPIDEPIVPVVPMVEPLPLEPDC